MIIKRLKLQNYRRFKNLELELPENIIGILGNNGVGKTTIVESIGWCLYGNRIRRTDKQDIRSQFCDASEECIVELDFSCGGNEYRLIRKLKGKNAIVEAAIYRGAETEPEAVQERGVNEFIEKLLNLDYRSFFISVFAKQKDLAALSLYQPEERRKSIARLINIESIDRARDNVRSDRKSKRDTQNGMSAGLKDEKELKNKQKELQVELENEVKKKNDEKEKFALKQKEVNELIQGFEKLNQQREQYQKICARIEKWESLKNESVSRLEALNIEIDSLKKLTKEYEKLKPGLTEYKTVARIKEKLDKASSKYFQLQALLDEKKRFEKQISREQFKNTKLTEELKNQQDFNKNLELIEKEISEFDKELESLRQQLAKNEGVLTTIKSKGEEARNKKDKIEELGPESVCPVCTRPLKEHYQPVLTNFENELVELRQQYAIIKQTKDILTKKVQTIETALKEKRSSRDGILQAVEQFREREKQLKQGQEDLKELDKNLKQVDETIGKIGKIEYDEKAHKENNKKFKALTELRDKLLKMEENVNRLPAVTDEVEQVKKVLVKYNDEIKKEKENQKTISYDEQKYLDVKKNLENSRGQVESLKDKIHLTEQKIISINKDSERVDFEIKENKKLRKLIKQLKDEVFGRVRPLIAARASELLHLTTQGRYSIMELDEDYNIYLYDQAEKFPVNRFSGGEQDLANLCLRIAISQVVSERSGQSQINFIVLDEIFGSQDEQRKELILFALQRLYSQFRQIFIITHVDNIKDALPVIISVEEKSQMESRAVMA